MASKSGLLVLQSSPYLRFKDGAEHSRRNPLSPIGTTMQIGTSGF
jgi:hypothetical protein